MAVAADVAARCLFVACSLRTAVVVVARELGAMMTVESLTVGRVACGNRNAKAVRVRRAAMPRERGGSIAVIREEIEAGAESRKHCSGLRALLPLRRRKRHPGGLRRQKKSSPLIG